MAAERTHDMAAGVPFLMPVAIDPVPEGEAAVPEEFLRVQTAQITARQWVRCVLVEPSTSLS